MKNDFTLVQNLDGNIFAACTMQPTKGKPVYRLTEINTFKSSICRKSAFEKFYKPVEGTLEIKFIPKV